MENEMKKIKITCKGQKYVPIDRLKDFQGKLKKLDKNELKKLKRSIIKHGFSFPVMVWQDYILDGHQRLKATRELLKEGYAITDIPVVEIDAKDKTEAAEKLLVLNSQYAAMTNDGLKGFLEEFSLDFDSLQTDLSLPEIDTDLFLNLPEEKEQSELAVKPFGDKRDKMPMEELLHSVDLVKVSFSGGKDSAGMAIYLHSHFGVPKEKMLLEHYYNPFEWEDMSEYCKYFSETFGIELKEYGNEPPDEEKEKVKIYGKRNADNFMVDKLKNIGLPSPMQKWCFERYKQRVFIWVARRYKENNYIQAIGMRTAESPRRAKMEDRGITRDIQPFCYPIFNLSNEETFGLSIKHNIKLHHAYRFWGRTGCPFCPMQTHKDFKILREEYPEMWDKMLRLYLLSLDSDFYRTSTLNRPKDDLAHILGIRSDKTRKEDWSPPKGLTFWRGDA